MDADTLNLRRIFRKDCRYVVPTFQRPYVWNEEEQWQPFWHDLQDTVEALLAHRNAAPPEEGDGRQPAEGEPPPWFMGAIVLDQMRTPAGKVSTRTVIDGQQRLTTLQVLFAATRTVASKLSMSDQVGLMEKLMYNDADLVIEEDHRFKVWPIEPDRQAFREVMVPEGAESGSSPGDGKPHSLTDCYQYFVEEVHEWVTDGDEPASERMDALTDSLWKLVRIVVIDLDPADDAQVIFETLNARGTPLLAADLIKNRLFRQAEQEGQPADQLYHEYWQQFDEEDWRQEVSQGRYERPRIDVFIMHWLTMRKTDRVPAKELYPEFRDYLTWSGVTVTDVLEDIVHYAKVYENFTDPYPEGREGLFFRRLEVMEATTPYPALLWMYGKEGYPQDERTRAVEALESWMTRRMLCRLTTKNYNRIFLQLLDRLQDDPDRPVDELIVSFFRDKDSESDYWPTDEVLSEAMVKLPYWARINQQRLKMVFRALERELRSTGYTEGLNISQNLHIEHILPQDWAHNWSLPGDRPKEVERIERDEAKHTVGNLTVLTEKLNPALSNAAWERKREGIRKHSVLLLNKDLVEEYHDRWDEETIAHRGQRLANLAAKVWPGPKSSYWD